MKLDFNNDKSIYLQIAESIEDDILRGALPEESQVPSTNQIAVLFKINPATAGKGIAMLVEEGTLYKKRGIGMFVAEGAHTHVAQKRRKSFYDSYVRTMLAEAAALDLSREEIVRMILDEKSGG